MRHFTSSRSIYNSFGTNESVSEGEFQILLLHNKHELVQLASL
jgi:hypothetical protein